MQQCFCASCTLSDVERVCYAHIRTLQTCVIGTVLSTIYVCIPSNITNGLKYCFISVSISVKCQFSADYSVVLLHVSLSITAVFVNKYVLNNLSYLVSINRRLPTLTLALKHYQFYLLWNNYEIHAQCDTEFHSPSISNKIPFVCLFLWYFMWVLLFR